MDFGVSGFLVFLLSRFSPPFCTGQLFGYGDSGRVGMVTRDLAFGFHARGVCGGGCGVWVARAAAGGGGDSELNVLYLRHERRVGPAYPQFIALYIFVNQIVNEYIGVKEIEFKGKN